MISKLTEDGLQGAFEEVSPGVFAEIVAINPLSKVTSDLKGYLAQIARGAILGAGTFRMIGRNPDIDDVREDIWELGGNYVFPPDAGIQMRVVSTSASDSATGTGIRSIKIHYLDADGNQQNEVIVLNGTTPVLTVATNIRRINDFHAQTVGSEGDAIGNISLTNTAASQTYAYIEINGNRARQAVWTVPAGKIAFINEVWLAGNSEGGALSNFAEGYIRTTSNANGTELLPGVFNFKWGAMVASNTAGGEMEFFIPVPALADIKMSATSRAAVSNVRVIGCFAGWYEDNIQQS